MRSSARRFALVGVVNTAIDFLLFAALTVAGAGVFTANTISTSAGMAFSFVANRRFSFGSTASVRSTVGPFIAVTLVCLWGIHPIVIVSVSALLTEMGSGAGVSVLVGKLAAIIVGLAWNYTWYHRFVFADRPTVR